MGTSLRTFTALLGKLRPRKRAATDPNALLVDQQQAQPDRFHDHWGSYGPPVESPSDFTGL
jgi:hypothetical protein